MFETPPFVIKYLNKFAVDNWKVNISDNQHFEMIVVIPAIKEFENVRKLLTSLYQNDPACFSKTLILFVLNNLESSSIQIKKDNCNTLELLERLVHKRPNDEFEADIISANLNIGFIDCSSPSFELPEKDGGVGLARKIGMDCSLKLFNYSSGKKNILVCLDSDCTVADNYLYTIYNSFNENNLSAGYVNFSHSAPANSEEHKAIINYEIFLRYYVLGLTYANSPYAFFTIGSTMVCDVESYVRVGGMNKKKAAEDFYFMEKLSKITNINKIYGTTVFPSSRGSWRVPFGTGQRVNRFLSKVQNEYLIYNPESFIILKEWIRYFSNIDAKANADEILEYAEKIFIPLKHFLEENSFQKNWENIIRNSKTEKQLDKQKQFWFDGFKSLKLIHFLRDNGFPLVNTFAAVEQMLGLSKYDNSQFEKASDIPSIEIQVQYLNILRKII